MPVRFFFFETCLVGQCQGAVERAHRLFGLPEAELAQRQIAKVLTGGTLELVSLADCKSLLVVLCALAILTEQQVNSTNIA